jgi:hypothetical protein
MQFDREKFQHLVHYVAWKAGKRDWFGATKLNKVLWFADARLFVLTGKSITGEVYIREKYGPVPKHIMPARADLQKLGIIRVIEEGKLTRIVSDVPPNKALFSERELQEIDYWIEHIDKEHTAQSISDQSHDYAWDIAKMGEELPLYAVLANRIREPDDRELEQLRKQAKKLGLIN